MVFNMGAFGVFLKKAPCPGFNCHGCPWATAACPVGVVSFGLSVRALPALAIGTVLAIGAAVGRLVCAFACPFGLLQELLYRFPTRKFGLPRWTRYVKYAALALLVVLLPYLLGFERSTQLRLYYCKVCPNGTLTATLPAVLRGTTTDLYAAAGSLVFRFGILALFLALMVLVSRGFCRTFCPLGAMYGLASRLAVWRVRVDETACTTCGLCDKTCPVGLDVKSEAGGAECIACGECIRACPKGAVERKFGL
jgi:polyferredoxin